MRNDAVARREWSFRDSTISDNVKRREVRRCHMLREGVTLSFRRKGENVREPLYEMELRSSVPVEVAGSSFAFTWDFDYRDYEVGSANGRSADVGITQLCIVPSVAKKDYP